MSSQIQILRGSNANIVQNTSARLNAGQPLYNTNKNYLTISHSSSSPTTIKPIVTPEVIGFAEDGVDNSTYITANTTVEYSINKYSDITEEGEDNSFIRFYSRNYPINLMVGTGTTDPPELSVDNTLVRITTGDTSISSSDGRLDIVCSAMNIDNNGTLNGNPSVAQLFATDGTYVRLNAYNSHEGSVVNSSSVSTYSNGAVTLIGESITFTIGQNSTTIPKESGELGIKKYLHFIRFYRRMGTNSGSSTGYSGTGYNIMIVVASTIATEVTDLESLQTVMTGAYENIHDENMLIPVWGSYSTYTDVSSSNSTIETREILSAGWSNTNAGIVIRFIKPDSYSAMDATLILPETNVGTAVTSITDQVFSI